MAHRCKNAEWCAYACIQGLKSLRNSAGLVSPISSLTVFIGGMSLRTEEGCVQNFAFCPVALLIGVRQYIY